VLRRAHGPHRPLAPGSVPVPTANRIVAASQAKFI
jgi:hypothetical protein